jgi:glycosyltransferase involved in cell wall biosynthesis
VLLAALVEHADHVCCRYRLAAFRPFLEQAGHRLELLPRPRRTWEWLGLGRRLRDAHAVIVQRKLLHPWQLRLLRGRSRLLIFDFDDAIFLRHACATDGNRPRRFAHMVRSADMTVAGNDFLGAQAIRCAGASRVGVIPTCVDPVRYKSAAHARTGRGVELAWIGSSSTLRGLEAARPMLETLGRQVPGLRLKIVCDRFPRLQRLRVVECPWSEAGEAEALAAADIGISWLPHDCWSRGKCGLKVLQYMAAGLPVVANPVGVQAEMVRPGETGFLAETPGQWLAAVGRLAHDPALRRRMGRAGRRLLEADYGVGVGAARWVALIEELQATGPQWDGSPRRALLRAGRAGTRLRFS